MNDFEAAPPGASPVADQLSQLEFQGSGAEYFRIWIVNLALSIVTLGIYSAWAKVRRLRYFYGNTYLAGSSFGYHADPLKILKGRIIAVAFFLAYTFGGQISPAISLVTVALFIVALPWIVVRSRMFLLRSTSYRNIRFGFARCYREAIVAYLLWGLATGLTLGLLYPLWMAKRYEFLVRHSRFGATGFDVRVSARHFYRIYFIASLMAAGLVVLLALVGLTGASAGSSPQTMPRENVLIMVGVFYAVAVPLGLGVSAYVQSRSLNAVYNATILGPHRLQSRLAAWPLFRIYLGNLLLIALTLGLFVPWARVRLARYRAASTAVLVHGSLDEFVGVEAEAGSAVGEEVGNFFDVDFGL